MTRALHFARWILRAGGWQRITWPHGTIGRPIQPLWVRHSFGDWMNP